MRNIIALTTAVIVVIVSTITPIGAMTQEETPASNTLMVSEEITVYYGELAPDGSVYQENTNKLIHEVQLNTSHMIGMDCEVVMQPYKPSAESVHPGTRMSTGTVDFWNIETAPQRAAITVEASTTLKFYSGDDGMLSFVGNVTIACSPQEIVEEPTPTPTIEEETPEPVIETDIGEPVTIVNEPQDPPAEKPVTPETTVDEPAKELPPMLALTGPPQTLIMILVAISLIICGGSFLNLRSKRYS